MSGRSYFPSKQTNRSMPPGIIIPELVYDDLSAAVAWLCAAFGFKERLRIGNHRVQLIFEGTSLIVVANPARREAFASGGGALEQPNEINHSVMVRVADVDPHEWGGMLLDSSEQAG